MKFIEKINAHTHTQQNYQQQTYQQQTYQQQIAEYNRLQQQYKVNNLKIEITFTMDNIENEIILKHDFDKVSIIKFRFVNNINNKDRIRILTNNLHLLNHQSEIIREKFSSSLKTVLSGNA